MRRVMRPRGTIVLGFRPSEPSILARFPKTTHRLRSDEKVAAALTAAGFENVKLSRYQRGERLMGYARAVRPV